MVFAKGRNKLGKRQLGKSQGGTSQHRPPQENQDNYTMAFPRKCEHRKELNLTQLWSSQNLPAKNHFRSVWRLAKLNQYSCGWWGASELWSRPRHSSGRRAQSSLKPFSSIVSIIMQSISPLVKVNQTTWWNSPRGKRYWCLWPTDSLPERSHF